MHKAISLPEVNDNVAAATGTETYKPNVQLARFLPGRILGTGTFSVVKIATHSVSKRNVAMKHLSKRKIQELGTRDRVQREIGHLRLCAAHPHITRLYAVADSPADTILVMEYVSGGDLHAYVGRKKSGLPPDEARAFFQQTVSAVEYMHHKRVAHRDLKLENVLLASDHRNVKLADFGLSNTVRDGEFMRTPCGSPHYAAPEVISGTPYDGPAADLWSCGVILYSLLCGKLPFQETSIPEQFKKIKSGTYRIPKHVTRDAQELIRGLLTVDTGERITIAAIRTHPWFRHQLPAYLNRSPASVEEEERKIVDSGVVDEVVRLYGCGTLLPQDTEVTRELVEKAVALEGINDSVGPNDETLLDLLCSYELILDDKHERRRASDIMTNHSAQRASSSWLGTLIRRKGSKI